MAFDKAAFGAFLAGAASGMGKERAEKQAQVRDATLKSFFAMAEQGLDPTVDANAMKTISKFGNEYAPLLASMAAAVKEGKREAGIRAAEAEEEKARLGERGKLKGQAEGLPLLLQSLTGAEIPPPVKTPKAPATKAPLAYPKLEREEGDRLFEGRTPRIDPLGGKQQEESRISRGIEPTWEMSTVAGPAEQAEFHVEDSPGISPPGGEDGLIISPYIESIFSRKFDVSKISSSSGVELQPTRPSENKLSAARLFQVEMEFASLTGGNETRPEITKDLDEAIRKVRESPRFEMNDNAEVALRSHFRNKFLREFLLKDENDPDAYRRAAIMSGSSDKMSEEEYKMHRDEANAERIARTASGIRISEFQRIKKIDFASSTDPNTVRFRIASKGKLPGEFKTYDELAAAYIAAGNLQLEQERIGLIEKGRFATDEYSIAFRELLPTFRLQNPELEAIDELTPDQVTTLDAKVMDNAAIKAGVKEREIGKVRAADKFELAKFTLQVKTAPLVDKGGLFDRFEGWNEEYLDADGRIQRYSEAGQSFDPITGIPLVGPDRKEIFHKVGDIVLKHNEGYVEQILSVGPGRSKKVLARFEEKFGDTAATLLEAESRGYVGLIGKGIYAETGNMSDVDSNRMLGLLPMFGDSGEIMYTKIRIMRHTVKLLREGNIEAANHFLRTDPSITRFQIQMQSDPEKLRAAVDAVRGTKATDDEWTQILANPSIIRNALLDVMPADVHTPPLPPGGEEIPKGVEG